MNALEICESDERLFGIALSGGDYTKDLQTHITGTGIELMGARQQMIIAARAAGVQCFDTVYTDLKDMDGFRKDVENIHLMASTANPSSTPSDPHRPRDLYSHPEGHHLRREGRQGDRLQEGTGHRRLHR